MTLTAGTKLGQYEIAEAIGAGGIEFLIHVKPFLQKIRSLLCKL